MPLNNLSGYHDEPASSRNPEEARARIEAHYARARLGQWGLAAFIVLSLAAFQAAPFLDRLPQSWRAALGPAPPTRLISIALAVYTFAALIYILARMMEGGGKYHGWSHLGYLSGFYFFYGYAESLQENFWAVLVAGFTILCLEHYRIWSHCNEAIRLERQTLAGLERRERELPSDS
jgi:hypothetical protein